MSKRITVIFTNNNARIVKGNQPFNEALPHVINPDLSKVKGIPPHFWVKDGDSIRGMTEAEKNKRLKSQADGIDNNILSLPIPKKHKNYAGYIIFSCVAIILFYFLYKLAYHV